MKALQHPISGLTTPEIKAAGKKIKIEKIIMNYNEKKNVLLPSKLNIYIYIYTVCIYCIYIYTQYIYVYVIYAEYC